MRFTGVIHYSVQIGKNVNLKIMNIINKQCNLTFLLLQIWSHQGWRILAGWLDQTRAAWRGSRALATTQFKLNHNLWSVQDPFPFTAS